MPEEYRKIDPAMIERIENEIVYTGQPVTWDDIGIYLCPFHNPVAGLDYPKRCVMEMVVWPMQRPDIFTGLREVPRGMNCSRSIQKQRSVVIWSSRNGQDTAWKSHRLYMQIHIFQHFFLHFDVQMGIFWAWRLIHRLERVRKWFELYLQSLPFVVYFPSILVYF